MRQECTNAKELTEEGLEVFLITPENFKTIREKYANLFAFLIESKFADYSPMGGGTYAFYWCKEASGGLITVSKTHVRLPKLSHLITLVPRDFFTLIRLVTTAKNTQTMDSLSLNPPAVGIQVFEQSPLYQFFTVLRVNYRFNVEYADRKWTPRAILNEIAALEPSRETHLSAMQYLTAQQNDDLLYFPADAAVDFEWELEPINDDYVVPPAKGC
jgi:hypothetical protein